MNLPLQINNSTFNMTVLIIVQKAKRFITQRKQYNTTSDEKAIDAAFEPVCRQ